MKQSYGKATIVFTDDTEATVDGVDVDALKERFTLKSFTESGFIVAGNLIVQCSEARYITFPE